MWARRAPMLVSSLFLHQLSQRKRRRRDSRYFTSLVSSHSSYRFCSEPPPHLACPQALELPDKAQPPCHQRLRLGNPLQKTTENQLGPTYLVGRSLVLWWSLKSTPTISIIITTHLYSVLCSFVCVCYDFMIGRCSHLDVEVASGQLQGSAQTRKE